MNKKEIQQAVYGYAEGFQDPDPETARLLELLGDGLTGEPPVNELTQFFKAMEELK